MNTKPRVIVKTDTHRIVRTSPTSAVLEEITTDAMGGVSYVYLSKVSVSDNGRGVVLDPPDDWHYTIATELLFRRALKLSRRKKRTNT